MILFALGSLLMSLDTTLMTDGVYRDVVTLRASGFNASGYRDDLRPIYLKVRGAVIPCNRKCQNEREQSAATPLVASFSAAPAATLTALRAAPAKPSAASVPAPATLLLLLLGAPLMRLMHNRTRR